MINLSDRPAADICGMGQGYKWRPWPVLLPAVQSSSSPLHHQGSQTESHPLPPPPIPRKRRTSSPMSPHPSPWKTEPEKRSLKSPGLLECSPGWWAQGLRSTFPLGSTDFSPMEAWLGEGDPLKRTVQNSSPLACEVLAQRWDDMGPN